MSVLRTSLSICIAFSLGFASCKPDDDGPKPKALGLKSVKPEPVLPIVDDVFGAMYSIKIYENISGKEVKSESASAKFYDEPSNTATGTQTTDAGMVVVNNINLNSSENNEYVRTATEGAIIETLNYNDGVTWVIQGEDGIPPTTFSWSANFPEYKGYFPPHINRKQDLTFTFDNNSVSLYADSIFVTISAGDKILTKRYGAHQGKVTIPSSELSELQQCLAENPAYLQISTCVVDIFYLLGGNPTVLVKQQADTRTVVLY